MNAKILAARGRGCHLKKAMKCRAPLQVLALFLGIVLALGTSVSAVQASEMAVQTLAASDAAVLDHPECDSGCTQDDGRTGVAPCASFAYCSVAAVLQAAGKTDVSAPTKLILPALGLPRDLAARPDPYPPRSLNRS